MVEKFGSLLRKWRELSDLTQAQLLKELRLEIEPERYSTSDVSKWEHGRIPAEDIVGAFEKILSTPEGLLLRAAGYSGTAEYKRLREATSAPLDIETQPVQSAPAISRDWRAKELVKHIINGDISAGLTTINNVKSIGLDLRQFNREVVRYLRGLLLIKTGSDEGLDFPAEDVAELESLVAGASLAHILKVVKLFGQLDGLTLDSSFSLPLELALVDCSVILAEASESHIARTRRVVKSNDERGKRMTSTGEIFVGTCSWHDLMMTTSHPFFPSAARTPKLRLRYYASQFPIIEVDSSYYSLVDHRTTERWADNGSDRFIFDVKAFRLFTLHPTPVQALPEDISRALPSELKERANVCHRDVPEELVSELWRRFEYSVLPMDSAGKLGVIMLQFPAWFYPGNRQRDYILWCKEKLPRYRIAIEFGHNSWTNGKNLLGTLSFLRDNGLSFVSVDEPQGFKSSRPSILQATSDIAVVKFYGRNRETWEEKNTNLVERFNYLYKEDELREWVRQITELASTIRQVHVLFNNCYQGKAVTNARELSFMLGLQVR